MSGCTTIEKEVSSPSNIILILADDHSFRAIGAYGDEVITPNLDRLTRSGTTFTHAYNMGGWS